MRRTASERGIPMVFLGESSGARIPDNMGAYNMGTILGGDATQYRRLREQPWASAVLGMAYGSATWYGCLSDFNVMRKGAVMAVSSERLVSMAIGEKVDGQELGGWRMHTDTTGLVDLAVDTCTTTTIVGFIVCGDVTNGSAAVSYTHLTLPTKRIV